MSKPSRGPRALSDILGELFTVRGYSQRWARQELEDVWNAAVGEPYCRQTRVGEVRGGVLNVTVAHSTLLEELTAFRKPALLAALRSDAPATTIHDIRFRVGAVTLEVESPPVLASSLSAAAKPAWHCQPTRRRRAQPGKRSKPHRSSGYNPGQP
jgi:hypothetical protein